MNHWIKKLKIVIIPFVCFIFLFMLISCDKKEKPKLDESINKDIDVMKNHLIPLDDAFKMYDTYTKNRNLILRDTLQKMYGGDFYDSRTVWFDYNTIKEYIKYVEAESAIINVDPQGIKICFGVYSNDSSLGKMANHQNVFLVPTTENKGQQSAYTIQNGKVLFLKNARGSAASLALPTMMSDDGVILNRGVTQPPPGGDDDDF